MTMKINSKWTAERVPSQTGRRVLITGANSGIGYEAALELARKGAELVLPARTLEKANGAAKRIAHTVPSARIVPAVLDLASQSSVRQFAGWFSTHYGGPSLDLLINNAGVMAVPTREITEDGFERQFATNFLGPFALTALLYPHLRQQPGTRVVIVSSSVTNWAKLDFANLQSERRYKPMEQAYGQSKLADSLFAVELQRRLSDAGSPVVVTAAHPGYAITNLQTSGPGDGLSVFRVAGAMLKPIASQNAHQGALPTLFAATAPEAEPGGYYGPDGLFELKGFPTTVKIPARAQDPDTARRLWGEAERLTGVTFDLSRYVTTMTITQ
jgi:NAD(P)-dependent dehydrogenase (short-subunit alcohol dehydrogenase family)